MTRRTATIVTLAFCLVGCSREQSPPDAAKNPDEVVIDKKYWVCTSTHISHHDAIELGNAKTIRRKFPACDKEECDQWSAEFARGCPKTNALCQRKGTQP